MTTTTTTTTTTLGAPRSAPSDSHVPATPDAHSHVPATPDAHPRGHHRRLLGALVQHRRSLAYVVPLLVATAAARLWNLGGSPQRIDDEGTYTAQAWAVETLGQLGHYTYWYDHPPLGWIQIAAWTGLTGGFERYDNGVFAAREAMVVAAVVSAALLWVLARRLGVGRPAASAAVLLFALSPLAVQFTRTVYLDNVATPWVLAAFVLALSRQRQLLAFAGSAMCFAVAVLSKETTLLLLPVLVWQLLRSATPSTRRYTLSVSAALLVLLGVGYVAFAAVKGEVLPGEDRVSLWEGITFQLVSRDSSGSVLDASSQAGLSVRTWLDLGAPLLVGGLVAAVVGLAVPRLRPYAAAYLLLALTLLKPGYLPVPFVIAMIPFAALLVAGVVEAGLRGAHRARRPDRGHGWAALGAAAGVAVVVAASATWPGALGRLWTANDDRPLRQAEAWLTTHVEEGEQVLVDDASWLALVRGGLPREDVVWYYKADTDAEVTDLYPNGWSDYEYVMVTEGVRQSGSSSPVVESARENGIRVATFGDGGPETVEVVRILPQGTDAFYAAEDAGQRARAAAGRELVDNPALELDPAARAQLVTGEVDSRLVLLLAQLAADHDLTVDGFPVVRGEEGNEFSRRTVQLSAVDGLPVDSSAAQDLLRAARNQVGDFAPRTAEARGDQITIRYPVAVPNYLLPVPPES